MSAQGQNAPIAEQLLRQACAELDRRLRAGEACSAEELLARYPELAVHDDSALELIYTEVALREELGQPLPADQWYVRFPRWRDRLERLLGVHQALRQAESANTLRGPDTPLPVGDGTTFPSCRPVSGYEVLEEIGRGGMGVVYKARQRGLNRLVALKKILAGDLCNAHDRARFRTEAEAAARLQHPHIVQIHEVGELDGEPFLALEYVDGDSLAQQLARGPLAARAAAHLIETLARAMQYAHQRGIIHRDLKPANILLAVISDQRSVIRNEGAAPDHGSLIMDHYVPKITDFGLAKHLCDEEKSTLAGRTKTGAILGTPSYMAPEQTTGGGAEVGPAVDVYSLGAILYEALTGRPPFQGATALDTLEQVRSCEPVPPSRLQATLPRDLETICLKCLEKEPRRRYASAHDLAEDLGRFLRGEPIQARPAGLAERTWKWARRRPAVALLLATVALLTVAGFTTVTILWRQTAVALADAEQSRQAEEEQRRQTEAHLAARLVTLARIEWSGNNRDRANEYLSEVPLALRDRQWRHLHRMCNAELLLLPHPGYGGAVAFSPDGRRVAAQGVVDQQATVHIWDATTGRVLIKLTDSPAGLLKQTAFSPDEARLTVVYLSIGRLFLSRGEGPRVTTRVWNTVSGEKVIEQQWHPSGPVTPGLSRDGKYVILPNEGGPGIGLREVVSGRLIHSFSAEEAIRSVALSPDGRCLAGVAVGKNGLLHVWDTATGELSLSIRGLARVGGVPPEFSPDGRRLVLVVSSPAQVAGEVQIWDVATGKAVVTFRAHTDSISSVAFSPDGRRLATASNDRTMILWDAVTGKELLTFRGHTQGITGLTFSPDGQHLATASPDGTVRIWDARPFEE